jgi:Bacterial Ig domain
MWFVINFVGALLLLTSPAFADSCVFSLMPPYALKSDAVNWEIQIASGKTCTKGLKYGSVNITNVKLTAPPEFGKVTVQGPGFSYTAKPNFEGQDAFTIQVAGTMARMSGTSDIQVTVSVAK